jgi:hypothetical protein
MTLSRQTIVGSGVAAAILTAVALSAANFAGDSGDNGGAPEYAVTLAVSLLVAIGLFGWAIPRTSRPAMTGLVVGVIALLSVAAYWTGLPYVLGPAAVVLGQLGRARSETRMPATIAVALGLLATAGGIAAVVVDQMT